MWFSLKTLFNSLSLANKYLAGRSFIFRYVPYINIHHHMVTKSLSRLPKSGEWPTD